MLLSTIYLIFTCPKLKGLYSNVDMKLIKTGSCFDATKQQHPTKFSVKSTCCYFIPYEFLIRMIDFLKSQLVYLIRFDSLIRYDEPRL